MRACLIISLITIYTILFVVWASEEIDNKEHQTTHKETTIETTTAKLIIEENTLGGSNAK